MSNPFIGKPLPQIGDIIENPDDGLKYRVASVERNEFHFEVTNENTYRVTLVPFFDWVEFDAARDGKPSA
jgi:hypothetical protein